MKRTQILVNKPVYLGLSVLETNKLLMYESWYYYVKTKYEEKEKLSYMDTDTLIFYIKTEAIYVDIAKEVKTRSDTSN